jgi:predicted nucleic acid-binding protein
MATSGRRSKKDDAESMTSDRFVVDASVAIAWVHPGQATVATQTLLSSLAEGAVFEVPSISLKRRGRLTERERRLASEWLRLLPHAIDSEASVMAFDVLSDLAAKHGLSVYDAAYLELAGRRGLALVSKDGALVAAARKARVAVWAAS